MNIHKAALLAAELVLFLNVTGFFLKALFRSMHFISNETAGETFYSDLFHGCSFSVEAS